MIPRIINRKKMPRAIAGIFVGAIGTPLPDGKREPPEML